MTWLAWTLCALGFCVLETSIGIGIGKLLKNRLTVPVHAQLYTGLGNQISGVDLKIDQLAEAVAGQDIAAQMAAMTEPELRGLAARVQVIKGVQ